MRLHLIKRWALGLGVAVSVLLHGAEAIAAETLVLQYRVFRESVSIGELSALADTGEVSPTLRAYLRLTRKDPEEVRQTITQKAHVDQRLLDRLLNSPVGNVVLDQVSQSIHTQSRRADRQAMRSALTLSASDDNQISLIEVMQNYPTEEVYVDGDRLETTYNQIRSLEGRIETILEGAGVFERLLRVVQ